MFRDGCEPELHLSLGSIQDCSSAESSRTGGSQMNSEQRRQQQQQQRQQITIFYNGQIFVFDVMEFQARAIISMAEREMDDRIMKKDELQHQQQQELYHQKNGEESSPPQPPPQLLNQGLSMKQSLQRFLQKRKTRINAASPYNYRHEMLFSSTS